MSTQIAAENLGHSYHDEWLFRHLTIGINPGQRLALVGVNGAGKSTLLKLLADRFPPMEGKIVKNRHVRIGFLEQDPQFPSSSTISEYIFSEANKQLALIKRYEELVENPVVNELELQKIYEELTEQNAWEYEHAIKTILSRMDIHHLHQRIDTLSGGQKKRIALAKLLIDDPDVYVLDEPTNHLDIDTIEWLEKLLTTGQKSILLVTHDRYFLDQVCNSIIELDRGKAFTYQGNYAFFLEKKAERMAMDESSYQKNKNLLKKELEWMRRMPSARTTKSKSRIDAFHELADKTKQRPENQKITLDIKMTRQGGKILELEQVTKKFETKSIVDHFSYVFKKGDRIGLAGKNGSGKSTFLNLLTGSIAPDSGSITKGETTNFGYYTQAGLSFNEKDRVIDVVKSVAEYIQLADGTTVTASGLLTLFLFPPKKQHGLIEKLSGGEKKRLYLMKVLMKNPNFLILDEPTNDLDIDTLNVLESFLENYPGVLILVSHDRYLLDKMSEQLFIMENGSVNIFNGNYAAYREELQNQKETTKAMLAPTPVKNEKTNNKTKLSFNEQKELLALESRMEEQEHQKKTIQTQLISTDPADYVQLQKLSKEIEIVEENIEKAMERWMELSEKLN